MVNRFWSKDLSSLDQSAAALTGRLPEG